MTLCLLLAATACAAGGELARLNGILDTLNDIRDQVDTLPADIFRQEKPKLEHPVTFIAEASDYPRQTESGTLTVGMIRDDASFDPCISTFAVGMNLVYDTLFYVDSEGEIRGQLAEEWEYRDETHLYIRLRPAVFSNGDAVTAEDCLWSLRRFSESGSRWHALFDFIDFRSSEAISSTELILAMKEDFGPGIRYLASYFSAVLDKDYVEAVGEEAFIDQPVGSGPYICIAEADDSACTFELREGWEGAGELPEAGTVRIRFFADSAAMFSAYESGDLDMAFGVGAVDAERLLTGEAAGSSYVIRLCGDVCSLVLPEYVEAFRDVRVRRAIAMAVDWTSVREAGYGILCAEADSVFPDGVMYKESCGTWAYDPEAARVLLEEAGYDYGQSFEFAVDNSEASIQMAKAIQSYLLAVGIDTDLHVYGKTRAEERYRNGETDLALRLMGLPALDPDQILCDCAAWSDILAFRFDEEPLPTYLEIGRWSTDDAIRQECYHNAQSWMYEMVRQIVIAEPYVCFCYRPYIDPGFSFGSVGMPDLRSVSFLKS